MTSGEVLDTALAIYQRHGFLFLRRSVGAAFLTLAALEFLTSYVLPGLQKTSDPSSLATQLGEVVYTLGIGLVVAAPLMLYGISYATTLAIYISSQDLTGAVTDEQKGAEMAGKTVAGLFRVLLFTVFRGLTGVLVSALLMMLGAVIAAVTPDSNWLPGILSLIGVLGLLAGGVIFLIVISKDSLAPAAFVIEGVDAKEAVNRSRTLMKAHPIHGSGVGNLFPAYFLLGFVLLVQIGGMEMAAALLGIFESSTAFLSTLPFYPVWRDLVRLIPEFLAVWTLVPLWGCILSTTYYDRRVRIEGLDIDILAKEIGRGRANRFDV